MEKKPYHHGNLEEALIEAGLNLVNRDGLEDMSLRRVAAACGVSHAAPYKHFDGKEELLAAMQLYVEDHFAEVLERAYRQGAEGERMLAMGQAYLRFFLENPRYFSFFQQLQGGCRVNLNNLTETSGYRPFEVFKQAALRELEPYAMPEEICRQTIVAMWAMVHGCTAISVMKGVDYRGDWGQMLDSILRYNMAAGTGKK